MIPSSLHALAERLFTILSGSDFLAMKGLANEVPIFIQTYDATLEEAFRQILDGLESRLRSAGVSVVRVDLFDLVLEVLQEHGLLEPLIAGEAEWDRADMLETLRNYSDPEKRLVPRLVGATKRGESQLTLVTGSGRIYPFLRTHTILESLQPKMLNHPTVIFFPGEYTQDPDGGSHLRLFGSVPSPRVVNAYYRAMNLDHIRI